MFYCLKFTDIYEYLDFLKLSDDIGYFIYRFNQLNLKSISKKI